MRVQRFEQFMKELIEQADHPEVAKVETFAEGGYLDKPYGLHVKFESGADVFVQFVRTSPDGGEDFSQPEKIVTREGSSR